MRPNKLIIKYKDADGSEKVRCAVEKWTWDDAMQGESYITFTLGSPVPVPFNVGDYCEYRGQEYTLNYVPSTIQQGKPRSTGNAFVYENVKMDSSRDELVRVKMLDITPTTGDYVAALGTNHTGSAYFQLYCGETTHNGKTLTAVCALAAKIQANLDRAYPTSGWKIHVDTTTTKAVGGKEVLVTHTDDKVLSFSNTSIQQALAEVKNTFDLDYFIQGRAIYIGYTMKAITMSDDDTYFYLGYGKGYADETNQGKGLFKLERNSDSNQMIVTRLRALGSTRNMPYRYYNKRYPDISQSMFPTNLQLPDTFEIPDIKAQHNTARKEMYPFVNDVLGDTNDAYLDKDNDCTKSVEGLREHCAKWDGSDSELEEIYPTIQEATYGELRANDVPDQDNATGASAFPNYGSGERIDEILSVDENTNIGDGILAENVNASQMEERFETEGWTVRYDKDNTSYKGGPWWGETKELTTFRAQNPGSYILTFTHLFYTIYYTLNESNPSVDSNATVKYRISFKYRSVATGIETDGPVYVSPGLTVNNRNGGCAEWDWQSYPLPDVDSDPQQVKEIKIEEQSDITVYVTPIFENFRSDLNYAFPVYLGKSRLEGSTDEAYTPTAILARQNAASTFMNTPFTVVLKDIGFDFKLAYGTSEEAVVAMKDGMCVAREFKIADNPEKVEYTRDGQVVKGWKLTLSRAQDTSINTYYPSENYPLKAGDHFVLLNVEMPDAYVRAAEVRLLVAASIYLADNCNTRFTYTPYIDDIYLQRNYDRCEKAGDVSKSIYWNLYAGLRFPFVGIPNEEGEGKTYIAGLTIEKITVTEGGLTPKVELKLVEEVQQTTIQKLTQSVNKLESQSIFNSNYIGSSMDKTSVKRLIEEYGEQMFLSKKHSDSTPYDLSANNMTARRDMTVGNNMQVNRDVTIGGLMQTLDAILSMLTGRGTIIKDGLVQTDRLEVRGSMTVMDLIINELQGMAADFLFSDVGKVIDVTKVDDSTYILYIDKRTDHDFTTLAEGDIIQQVVNSLPTGGTEYYSSWCRVVSVNQAANSITVVMYADSEVAGGKNYAPVAGYNVARRGNAIVPDEGMNERSQVWMLSSREGRIQFLQNVFKPILEDYNYALTLGKLPDIKALKSLPVTTDMVGLVAQTIIAQDFYQFDYNGKLVTNKIDRGEWSLEVAQGDAPYRFITYENTSTAGRIYNVLQQHTVWHLGCRWACLVDKTTQEPKWNATDWQMLEGYSDLRMEFTSSNGSSFAAGHVDTEVTPTVYYGNMDISEDIASSDWAWVYDLGTYTGRTLHITSEMMPANWSRTNKAVFTCTAYVRVGDNQVQAVTNQVIV